MNKMYFVIGDWSDDGHGKSEKFLIKSNKTCKEIQDAYKASCKLTGISFNGSEDYTETGRGWEEGRKYRIAVDYEDFELSNEVLEVLTKFKCPKEILEYYNEEAEEYNFTKLWFWFVSLSLPGLEYKNIQEINDTPYINGYWNKNLNVGFGYGLYS